MASFISSSSPPSCILPLLLALVGVNHNSFLSLTDFELSWHYGILSFISFKCAFTFSQDLDSVILALFIHCLPLHPPSSIIPSFVAVGPGRCESQFISFINWFSIKLTLWYLIFHFIETRFHLLSGSGSRRPCFVHPLPSLSFAGGQVGVYINTFIGKECADNQLLWIPFNIAIYCYMVIR